MVRPGARRLRRSPSACSEILKKMTRRDGCPLGSSAPSAFAVGKPRSKRSTLRVELEFAALGRTEGPSTDRRIHGQHYMANTIWPTLAVWPILLGPRYMANPIWSTLYGPHYMAHTIWPTQYGPHNMANTTWPTLCDRNYMAGTMWPTTLHGQHYMAQTIWPTLCGQNYMANTTWPARCGQHCMANTTMANTTWPTLYGPTLHGQHYTGQRQAPVGREGRARIVASQTSFGGRRPAAPRAPGSAPGLPSFFKKKGIRARARAR